MSASWVLWLSLAAALWILYKLLRFIRCVILIIVAHDHLCMDACTHTLSQPCGFPMTVRQCSGAYRSEVDMSLAAKGLAPPGAFRGKTVWITGASQARGFLCYAGMT